MDSHGGSCQYIVMIGLLDIEAEFGPGWLGRSDFVRERIMQKVLNINNHVATLSNRYKHMSNNNHVDSPLHSNGVDTKLHGLSPEEFFIYSVSVALNTNNKTQSGCGGDVSSVSAKKEGDGVCVITAKLPRDCNRQKIYTTLMQRLISPSAVVLKVHREDAETMRSNTQLRRGAMTHNKNKGTDIFNTEKSFGMDGRDSHFAFFSQTSLLLSKSWLIQHLLYSITQIWLKKMTTSPYKD